jgi:cysteine desulfurase / selenocysteine lyase
MDCAHPQDIGAVLDMEGVAIRAGHHCTMPLMQRYGLSATARASFALYNGPDDVAQLADGLQKVRALFG